MASAPRQRNRGGRPSACTPERLAEICARLSDGETLAVICRDDHMPCDDTVREWGRKDAAVSLAIARARDRGFDAIAHSARDVARGKAGSSGDVQRDRLIVETDLKLLAKWDPKRYGEARQIELTGAGGGPIQTHEVTRPTITRDEWLAAHGLVSAARPTE